MKRTMEILILIIMISAVASQSVFSTQSDDISLKRSQNYCLPPIEYEIVDGEIHFSVSEYDIYVYNLMRRQNELTSKGYSVQELNSLRTYEAEERISALSELSANELSELGYKSEQINLLKKYDGKPLEQSPEMAAVLPEVDVVVSAGDCSDDHVTAHLSWEWSAAPALHPYTDSIEVMFRAFDESGIQLRTRYHTSYTNASVVYKSMDTGELLSGVTTSVTSEDAYQHAVTRFERMNASLTGYAKSGVFNCYIQNPPGISADIAVGTFIFEYGCPRTVADYSISFPWGVSIDFGETVDVAFHVQVSVTSDGDITLDQEW